jgi:hypothetical protein
LLVLRAINFRRDPFKNAFEIEAGGGPKFIAATAAMPLRKSCGKFLEAFAAPSSRLLRSLFLSQIGKEYD